MTASNFGNIVMNAAASQVALRHCLAAANSTVSSGFAAGLDAIALGAELLREHRADLVLAGGADELSPATLAVLAGLGLLGEHGFVPGEAAVWLVLEREETGLARTKSQPKVYLAGHGSAFDPGALRHQPPAAAVLGRAMRTALAAAHCEPASIDLVLSSANGEALRDLAEQQALAALLPHGPATLAPKALLGECLGASGALAAALAATALLRGEIPGLPGAPPTRVLVNALGYSGHQSSLVLARDPA